MSASLRTQTGLRRLILSSPKHKESAPNGSVTSVHDNLKHGLVGNFNREF